MSPRPVPVCFVASGQAGGAERYLQTLLEAIGPDWVSNAVLLGDGPFAETLRQSGVEVDVLEARGKRGFPRASLALRKLLRERHPALVHANGVKPAAVSGMAATGLGVPVLWLKVDTALDGWRARFVARRCTEVVGMSQAAIASVAHLRGISATVVAGGIPRLRANAARGRAKLEDECGWKGEALGIVLSGRLCPGKGQLELIEAAPTVLAERPDARFALIGRQDPAYPGFDSRLRARLRELGLGDAFTLLEVESADEAIELVAGADIVVAPSIRADSRWREGFGLVIAEAMQVGVPVVAYDSGSLGEVLGDCGVLVPEGDREALAAGVLRLGGDPGLRRGAADCGRGRAERFRIERAAAEMCERYVTVAAG